MRRSGWLGIVAFVAVFDAWAVSKDHPTLSADFANAATRHPILMTTLTAYMVTHLYGRFPKPYDPLVLYVKLGDRAVQRLNTRKLSPAAAEILLDSLLDD